MLKRYTVIKDIGSGFYSDFTVKCRRMEVEGGALVFYANVAVGYTSIQEIVSFSIKNWVEVKYDGVENVD